MASIRPAICIVLGYSLPSPFRSLGPNGRGEPRPRAAATQERRLLGVGSSAGLGVLDDVCEHPDELAQIIDVVFLEV